MISNPLITDDKKRWLTLIFQYHRSLYIFFQQYPMLLEHKFTKKEKNNRQKEEKQYRTTETPQQDS
jgi:hypothetical protein